MTTQPFYSKQPPMGVAHGSPENPPHSPEGFFYPEIIDHIPDYDSPIARVVSFPGKTIVGLGSALMHVAKLHRGNQERLDSVGVERRIVPSGDHERVLLISQPDPELVDSNDTVRNIVLLPGLTEMDAGSALRLHQAAAKKHRDRLTATITTPGVSHSGKVLSIREGLTRRPEDTARENLGLIRFALRGGPSDLVGTSLGSHTAVLMAAQNLAANPSDQLDIDHVKLVAPAVGAVNVPADENFRDPETNEKELLDAAANDFFKHMLVDPAVMLLKHPEKTAECLAILGIYALSPHKFTNRAAAIVGNYTGVKGGVQWADVLDVARGTQLRVVGGERDPLMQASYDQWREVVLREPQTRVAVVKGMGHAMTIAATHAADYLAWIEGPRARASF